MKLSLSPLLSDILISIYVVVTLFLRIQFEYNNYAISTGYSLVIGLCCVAFLWSLIKFKVLNPNWFGLLNPKPKKS